MGSLSEWYFRDCNSVLVDFLDACAHLDLPSALAGVVFRAVGKTSGREVGIDLIRLAFQNRDRGVNEFIEVVGEDFGGHTDRNTLCALGKEDREADGELCRLLVSAVIGGHPVGHFRVENNLLGKLGKSGLYVPRSRI